MLKLNIWILLLLIFVLPCINKNIEGFKLAPGTRKTLSNTPYLKEDQYTKRDKDIDNYIISSLRNISNKNNVSVWK